jgi:hypothetical protein
MGYELVRACEGVTRHLTRQSLVDSALKYYPSILILKTSPMLIGAFGS